MLENNDSQKMADEVDNVEIELSKEDISNITENAEVESQTSEITEVEPKTLEINTIERHIDWIKKCINSCTNIEQLENCNSIVGIFMFKLKRDGVADNVIKWIQDELLEHYVSKEGTFIIPKSPYDKESN